MKRSISMTINEQKLDALEMYLAQKNTTLDAEMGKYAEQIYAQYVPKQVREYLALSERKPERRSRRPAAEPPEDSGQTG